MITDYKAWHKSENPTFHLKYFFKESQREQARQRQEQNPEVLYRRRPASKCERNGRMRALLFRGALRRGSLGNERFGSWLLGSRLFTVSASRDPLHSLALVKSFVFPGSSLASLWSCPHGRVSFLASFFCLLLLCLRIQIMLSPPREYRIIFLF